MVLNYATRVAHLALYTGESGLLTRWDEMGGSS